MTIANIPFDNVLLDLGFLYGTAGVRQFRTVQHRVGDREQRVSLWELPQHSWRLGSRTFGQDNPDSAFYIQDFFEARRGTERGFLFKDHADHEAFDCPVPGAGSFRQLVKRYQVTGVGSENYYVDRPITHPDLTTLKITENSIPLIEGLDYTVHDSGVIEFLTPLASTPLATFQFYVPCVFELNETGLVFEGANLKNESIYTLANLSVVELRWPLRPTWQPRDPLQGYDDRLINAILKIGHPPRARVSDELINYTVRSQTGWKVTQSRFLDPIKKVQCDLDISLDIMETILAMHWVSKGGFYPFWLEFRDNIYLMRGKDDLNIRFDMQNWKQKQGRYNRKFNISGLEYLGYVPVGTNINSYLDPDNFPGLPD